LDADYAIVLVSRAVGECDVQGHQDLLEDGPLVHCNLTSIDHLFSRTKLVHCLRTELAALTLGKEQGNVRGVSGGGDCDVD
jgi:hypothetical protein